MNDRVKELVEKINRLTQLAATGNEEMRAELSAAKAEFSELVAHNDELKTKHDELVSKHTDIETRIKRLEEIFPKSGKTVSLPGVDEGKDKFSFSKFFLALGSGNWKGAGYEHEVVTQTTRKAQMESDNEFGGFVVPAQVIQEIITPLIDQSIMKTLGVTTLTDLTGSPVLIPAGKGGAIGYWVGEGDPITPSDEKYGQVSLTPKKAGVIIKLQNRWLRTAMASSEAYVRRRMLEELDLLIDKAIFAGSGTEHQPMGVINLPGVPTAPIGDNGGDFFLTASRKMVNKLEDNNGLKGNLAFVMHSKVKQRMKEERIAQFSTDPGGEYVFMNYSDQALADRIGYKIASTNHLPSNLEKGSGENLSPVIFANWSDLIFGIWANMEFASTGQAGEAFTRDQTWIRQISEVDAGHARKNSFVVTPDAKTQD